MSWLDCSTIVVLVAWACAWIGYPFWGRLRVWLARSSSPRDHNAGHPTRVVTIVVAAHNEAGSIAARIRNLAEQRIPAGVQVEIVVVSDGSTDATAENAGAAGALLAAQGVTSCCIRVLETAWRGKSAACNLAVAASAGDLLLFTDASTVWKPDVAATLIAAVSAPGVGAASGAVLYANGRSGVSRGFKAYQRFARWMRQVDSAVSQVCVSGASHAVRRSVWSPIADQETADLVVPALAAAAGMATVLVHDAEARETPRESLKAEYLARVRIVQRCWASLPRVVRLMWQGRRWDAIATLALQKVSRWLVWVPAMMLFAVAAFGGDSRVAVAAQVTTVTSVVLAAWGLQSRFSSPSVATAAAYAWLAVVATAVGFARYLAGVRAIGWPTSVPDKLGRPSAVSP